MTDTLILIWYEGLEKATCNTDNPEKAIIDYVKQLILNTKEKEHIRCLNVVEKQFDLYTGPTGGWLVSPKTLFSEIAIHLLEKT